MDETHRRPGWRLRKLNLRDLFWLVLVVAMGCGWCLDHRERKIAIQRIWEGVWFPPLGAPVRDGFQVDVF